MTESDRPVRVWRRAADLQEGDTVRLDGEWRRVDVAVAGRDAMLVDVGDGLVAVDVNELVESYSGYSGDDAIAPTLLGLLASRLYESGGEACHGCGTIGYPGLAGWRRAYLRGPDGPTGVDPATPGLVLVCPQCAGEWRGAIRAYLAGSNRLLAALAGFPLTNAGDAGEEGGNYAG